METSPNDPLQRTRCNGSLALIMAAFLVFSHSLLVGTSDLESGAPPMGVAMGRFYPAEGYAHIQPHCGIEFQGDQSKLGLSVRTPAGDVIDCEGVGILDGSTELGPEGMEVHVLGIAWPAYDQLFPQHVAAYQQQFK